MLSIFCTFFSAVITPVSMTRRIGSVTGSIGVTIGASWCQPVSLSFDHPGSDGVTVGVTRCHGWGHLRSVRVTWGHVGSMASLLGPNGAECPVAPRQPPSRGHPGHDRTGISHAGDGERLADPSRMNAVAGAGGAEVWVG